MRVRARPKVRARARVRARASHLGLLELLRLAQALTR